MTSSAAIGLVAGVASADTLAADPATARPPAETNAPARLEADLDPEDVTARGGIVGQATSTVTARDMQERLARSTPEALRYEPGVFIQQSAHGQASAYVRGRTGQQTVLLFDGIRLNNASWRQGPNQYLFTVDPRTIGAIEVFRGGASTRFGSDAIGGAIAMTPLEPQEREAGERGAHPRAFGRYGSADDEWSLRVQNDFTLGSNGSALVGFSTRRVGLLRSGGPVFGDGGAPVLVPAFADDGRTQLGTGFGEVTADGRAVFRFGEDARIVAAAYVHRLFDVPRTDQCPAPYAPRSECLRVDEQFRTLAYVAYEDRLGALANRTRAVFSYQRQHERRTLRRPASAIENTGRDAVDTLGASWEATSEAFRLAPRAALTLKHGAEGYFDTLASRSWLAFTDIDVVRELSRGQYVEGSRYLQSGAFAEATLTRGDVALIAGARLGFVAASAPRDASSGTERVDASWWPTAAHATLRWRPAPEWTLLANVDRSFRAPNLDDLTARQQSGPGFLFENANLRPETTLGAEIGVRFEEGPHRAELWAFRSRTRDAIARSYRELGDCPPSTPACTASWSRYQLVNLLGDSTLDGLEASVQAAPWSWLRVRANVSFAYGDGPNPQPAPVLGGSDYAATVPLSRVPPLNGTIELRMAPTRASYASAGLRWATAQTRLAPTDYSDARIPLGGTPGFVVADVRAGVRIDRSAAVFGAIENVGDVAYRTHGSSINGAGRSLVIGFEFGW